MNRFLTTVVFFSKRALVMAFFFLQKGHLSKFGGGGEIPPLRPRSRRPWTMSQVPNDSIREYWIPSCSYCTVFTACLEPLDLVDLHTLSKWFSLLQDRHFFPNAGQRFLCRSCIFPQFEQRFLWMGIFTIVVTPFHRMLECVSFVSWTTHLLSQAPKRVLFDFEISHHAHQMLNHITLWFSVQTTTVESRK